MGLTEIVAQPQNALIILAVWALIQAAKKTLPELANKPMFARLEPLLPLILCSAAVWIPQATAEDIGTGERIMLGLVLGFAVGHAHKILGQTAFGRDRRIP